MNDTPKEPPPFKVGDTVNLRSGSPLMTVVEIGSDFTVCMWFEGVGDAAMVSRVEIYKFPSAALRIGRESPQL